MPGYVVRAVTGTSFVMTHVSCRYQHSITKRTGWPRYLFIHC